MVRRFLSALRAGFEALTEIQNLLDDTGNQELALRESLIVAASNRFFTLIPSVHPHIIRDKDDLTMKVCACCLALYSCQLSKVSYPYSHFLIHANLFICGGCTNVQICKELSYYSDVQLGFIAM